MKITQLQNSRIPYLWYPLFNSEFCWVIIDQLCKDCKRHARNRPLPPSQTAIKEIVKIQLRLTLTILYGDQKDNNYYEIRAQAS